MQPIEIALFGAVVALAAGLIGYLLWPFTRARRAATNKRWKGASPARPMVPAANAPAPSLAGVAAAAGSGGMMGKICPHCSRRYDSDATFCGRDGASLVSVN